MPVQARRPPARPAPQETAVPVQAHCGKVPAARHLPGQHLAPAGRGKPLPDPVRAKMERALGHDFSRVRVHEGGHAESLGAIAYTRGTDLHFAPGRYSPATRTGQELIGHELTHVVQQQAGRVDVPQGKGAPINADPALEAEADRLGALAARLRDPAGGPERKPSFGHDLGGLRTLPAEAASPAAPGAAGTAAVQRKNGKGGKGGKRDKGGKRGKGGKGGKSKGDTERRNRERDIKEFKKRGRISGEWPPHRPSGS